MPLIFVEINLYQVLLLLVSFSISSSLMLSVNLNQLLYSSFHRLHIKPFHERFYQFCWPSRQYYSSRLPPYHQLTALMARRKKSTTESDEDIEALFDQNKPGWVSIQFGNDDIIKKVDMDERVRKAEQFQSRPLTKEELIRFNKAMDIDTELLNEMAEEDELDEKLVKSSLGSSRKKSITNASKVPEKILENIFQKEDKQAAIRLRGFLELNPYICSGCGTAFQSKNEDSPGFLPKDKFLEHQSKAQLIRDKQEAAKILEMAGIDMDSDTARDILQAAKVREAVIEGVQSLAAPKKASPGSGPLKKTKKTSLADQVLAPSNDIDETGQLTSSADVQALIPDPTPSLRDLRERFQDDLVCICQRCFRLQQYGQVEQTLRPGWSQHELLTPERFETLLGAIRSTEAVVLCLIDLFDLHGSLLPNLKQIAGNNPIVIAANKFDLLPKDASSVRLTSWIHSEVKSICDLRSPRDNDGSPPPSGPQHRHRDDKDSEAGLLRRANVHLVSCQSGYGMEKLMSSLVAMAQDNGNKVFVMGAANVGKSSFINRLLESGHEGGGDRSGRDGKKKPRSTVPQATVSNLPGTTLDFLKIRLPNGVTMIDTPGLLNSGQLTSKLTTAELRQVIPVKPINAVTLRLEENKCVLVGGLATVHLSEGRPFFFTFFVSNEVKLHPTDITRAASFVEQHAGKLISPPDSFERVQELGQFETHEFLLEGEGWRKSCSDIVIAGLGWVAVTGVGPVKVRVSVPAGTAVGLRPSLLPFESSHSTAKFTGGKLEKRSRKGGTKSYGWRA